MTWPSRWMSALQHDKGGKSMVVLRCTQKLLVRLKRTDVSADTESTTLLGDWYGNTLRIGRQQYLLFISERSRLPVVIPIRKMRRLETIFPDTVCAALSAIGVASDDIADESFTDVHNRIRENKESQPAGNP